MPCRFTRSTFIPIPSKIQRSALDLIHCPPNSRGLSKTSISKHSLMHHPSEIQPANLAQIAMSPARYSTSSPHLGSRASISPRLIVSDECYTMYMSARLLTHQPCSIFVVCSSHLNSRKSTPIRHMRKFQFLKPVPININIRVT